MKSKIYTITWLKKYNLNKLFLYIKTYNKLVQIKLYIISNILFIKIYNKNSFLFFI